MADAAATDRPGLARARWVAHWPIWLGALALLLPTLYALARIVWTTEEGAQGPLVLATGLWLLWRASPAALARQAPGKGWIAALALVAGLIVYAAGRITTILAAETLGLYLALLAAGYALLGAAALRRIWFPVLYLGLLVPPPVNWLNAATQPLKLGLVEATVGLLAAAGYPIAAQGVTIQVGQFTLLMAEACAGLNSIIALTAVGALYAYLRSERDWRRMVILLAAVLPIAVLANFVRILLLVLLTYHFGDRVGQGFAHEFAGMTMFGVALASLFAVESLIPERRG